MKIVNNVMGILLLATSYSYGMEERLSLEQLVFKTRVSEDELGYTNQLQEKMQNKESKITVKTSFYKSNDKPLQPSQALLCTIIARHEIQNSTSTETSSERSPNPRRDVQLSPKVRCSIVPWYDGSEKYVFEATCKKSAIKHLVP